MGNWLLVYILTLMLDILPNGCHTCEFSLGPVRSSCLEETPRHQHITIPPKVLVVGYILKTINLTHHSGCIFIFDQPGMSWTMGWFHYNIGDLPELIIGALSRSLPGFITTSGIANNPRHVETPTQHLLAWFQAGVFFKLKLTLALVDIQHRPPKKKLLANKKRCRTLEV